MRKYFFLCIIIISIFELGFCQHGVGSEWQSEVLLPLVHSWAKQRGVLFNNIITTSDGRIIVSTAEVDTANVNIILGHYLTYSDDGGTTWLNPPVHFTPPNLVVGGSGVKLAMDYNDTLYALWSSRNPSAIFISKLDKSLNIIKDSIRVSSQVTNYSNPGFATHFTIDRYNRIHVMWNEGSPNTPQTAECFYTRSTDRGLTWSQPDTLSVFDGHHSAFPHAEFDNAGDTLAIPWRGSIGGIKRWDIYGVVSTNGGQTWSNPFAFICTNDSDWDPDLLVDNQGRFHLAYNVYPASNPLWGARVEYRYSDNVGTTWVTPSNPSNGQLSPSGIRSHLVEGFRYDMQNNVLWITWKDERNFNTSTGDAEADMIADYSTDRGITWSSPEFVTDRYDSTVAFKAGALLPDGEFCVNYEVISPGDINNPSGFLRVYFRKRNRVITAVSENKHTISNSLNLYQNNPNPFKSTVMIKFSLSRCNFVTLEVFDALGKKVATLLNKKEMNSGNHSIVFDAKNLSSGVYFCCLKTDNIIEHKKIELVK